MKNIIDIRSNSKYLKGHIDGAINISEYNLLYHHDKYLSKSEKYYLYCDYGIRSKMVSNRLNMMGYNTVNIDGGYNNYLLRI